MAINTSPEPASNIVMSVVEDTAVAGIVTLAIFYPIAAAVCAGILLLIGVILVVLLASRIRRYLVRRRQRRAARQAATARAQAVLQREW